jgi:hypothetical protein
VANDDFELEERFKPGPSTRRSYPEPEKEKSLDSKDSKDTKDSKDVTDG